MSAGLKHAQSSLQSRGEISTALTREDVRHISKLAMLNLSEEEVNSLGAEINSILALFSAVHGLPERSETVLQPAAAGREDCSLKADDSVAAAIIASFPKSVDRTLTVPRSE